jgi:[acyl-carrier-protein] S-malonyltransferase
MKTAFLFPGQGAQSVGMGRDVSEKYNAAAAVFEKADKILGYSVSDICFNGPEDKLNSTVFSQPAIFTMSAAVLEVIRSIAADSAKPDVCAGLSLGEYTALYAAGRISFEDGLKLVQKRGEAMQEAADASDGGMVSVLKLDDDKLEQVISEASQGELLTAANFNCPGQIVLSGSTGACERAAKLAEQYGALKAVTLKVAGAFHSSMMQPAADKLAEALKDCDIAESSQVPVIANVNAEYYTDAASVRDGLCRQLTQSVLYQKCVERLIADGCENFYEIGPGRVLTGLMKKIDRKKKVINLSNAAALEEIL